MREPKFYKSTQDGTMISLIGNEGEQFEESVKEGFQFIDPLAAEGAGEKHLPVVSVENNVVTVNIGSVNHPMMAEHYINWIYLQTNQGGQLKHLTVDGEPGIKFALVEGETAIAAYAYCNIHGLWVTKL